MKKSLALLTLMAAILAAGCNGDSSVSAAEEKAFKNPDKSAMKPPPAGSMKPPQNFSSSINDGPKGAPAAPGGG